MANNFLNYMIPEDMEQYLSYYGMNFNKKLCEFAVGMMERKDASGNIVKLTPMSVEDLKALLEKHKVELEPKDTYNALYVANMVKADYWGSSIEDEEHMAKYVKDVICDVDAEEGQTFARFLADCSIKGVPIYWEMMI